eukprot:7444098-Pyramimonas_sp.AAC.1
MFSRRFPPKKPPGNPLEEGRFFAKENGFARVHALRADIMCAETVWRKNRMPGVSPFRMVAEPGCAHGQAPRFPNRDGSSGGA